MAFATMIISLLASAAVAQEPPITVRGYPWAPFISPMGEPFRPPPTGQAPIAAWFAQADRNRDGALTADEMQLDADRFFARLDENEDGQIDREEVASYESVIAPEIQVNSNWRRSHSEAAALARAPQQSREDGSKRRRPEDSHDGYQINGLQGAARYGLLNIPQPVASADADFNRAVTLAEFRQAASSRFRLLDSSGAGRLTLVELQARLPSRPKGKRAKRPKNAVDTRIGLPLPEKD
jgi:Ca2+-binding EF-hand superfamily protein